jgi:hypothetical protein
MKKLPSGASRVRIIKNLRSELAEAKLEISRLRKQLRGFNHHIGTKTGADAEKFILSLFPRGKSTSTHSRHDLEVGKCLIEIKGSGCHSNGNSTSHQKWVWHKLRGSGGKKRYHLLVLVGIADPKYQSQYKHQDCGYVIFAIPHQGVNSFRAAAKGGTQSLGTDPHSVYSEQRQKLWEYQVSPRGLKLKVRELNRRLRGR